MRQLLYAIAREVGRTVGELEQTITRGELIEWSTCFKMESEAHEKAVREARAKVPRRGR